jgi:hypothetical protein
MAHNNMNYQRHTAYEDHLDDFPTPPWATRAFFQYVYNEDHMDTRFKFLDPAAGRGHMVNAVRELGHPCKGSDIKDYGMGFNVLDYTDKSVKYPEYDVLITNPPYKLALPFVKRGLREANIGVAILARTLWAEGGARYRDLFQKTPPSIIAIFSGRMPAQHGSLRRKGANMSHAWFWWDRPYWTPTRFVWIPPEAQKELEKEGDYV